MKKPNGSNGSIDAELNSLLSAWAQSNALPQLKAGAIQRAAKEAPSAEDAFMQNLLPRSAISGSGLPGNLSSQWWFGFAHNLTGALTQASRSWSYAGGVDSSSPA